MLGVDRAIDGGREHDAAMLLKPNEGCCPSRRVGREAGARDRDQSATVAKTPERGGDVAVRGVGHPAGDACHRRERRVHQHHARHEAGVEMIMDLRRVEPGDRCRGEEAVEESSAGSGEFVQHERSAGQFGEDGQQTRASGWLQNAIGRGDSRGGSGHQTQRNGGGELLKGFALRRAAGVGRQKCGDLRQHRQHGGRRCGLGADCRAEFAQEQDRRRFARVISGFPVPGAGCVGGAEGGLHRAAQCGGVDPRAASEMRQKEMRRLGDTRRWVGGGDERKG